jgi:type IV secretory pathway TrbF-like protein
MSELERTERRLGFAVLGLFGLGFLNALLVIGMWSVARTVPPPPPPIIIDPGGMVLYQGPPERYPQQELWAMTEVQRWLELVRERRGDPVHMAERQARATLFVDGPAVTQLHAYLDAVKKDPQHATNPMRVQVGQFRWQPPEGKDFAVTWEERWTPTYGAEGRTLYVSARFTVERRQRTNPFGQAVLTAGDMNGNPHGIYITSFSWMEDWHAPQPPHGRRVDLR